MNALARVVALLRWRWLAPGGALLGFLAGSLLRIRRQAVDAAMGRAGIGEARAMYAGLGTGALELLWLAGSSEEERARVIEAVRVDSGVIGHGPCILAASHTGNWELMAFAVQRAAHASGRRLAIVAKLLSVGGFHAFCMNLRERAGVKVIPPKGAWSAARAHLDKGGVVAMPIDQVPDRAGFIVPFLGADAFCDRAPATLAWRAKVPLIVIATRREGRTQRCCLLARLEPSGTNARTWIDEATRASTAALEAFVKEHPNSWMWLHRRWRAPLLLGG